MFDQLLRNVGLSTIFAVLGFVLLFVGYRVFDRLTPSNLGEQIFKEHNVAAAILAGAFVLALAIVVAAAIA